MIECGKCGSENTAGSNFCSNCGARLGVEPSSDTTRVIPVVVDEGPQIVEMNSEDQAAVEAIPEGKALLLVTRGPDMGARYLLDNPVTTVGRHPDSDIFLDDITVSRHHAKFIMGNGVVCVEDQGSLNGTYINRTLVDHSAPLRPGDEVQIGKFRMVYFVSEHGSN